MLACSTSARQQQSPTCCRRPHRYALTMHFWHSCCQFCHLCCNSASGILAVEASLLQAGHHLLVDVLHCSCCVATEAILLAACGLQSYSAVSDAMGSSTRLRSLPFSVLETSPMVLNLMQKYFLALLILIQKTNTGQQGIPAEHVPSHSTTRQLGSEMHVMTLQGNTEAASLSDEPVTPSTLQVALSTLKGVGLQHWQG